MSDEALVEYLTHVSTGSSCDDCDEPMKLLQFSWGESETHEEIITVLNPLLDKEEMLEKPFDYEELKLERCEDCGAVNLTIK